MASPQKKLCPFAATDPDVSAECLGEACACHVTMTKPAFLTANIVNPETIYKYEGCGLVNIIPWQLVESESKSPENKQAEEAYKKLDEAKP